MTTPEKIKESFYDFIDDVRDIGDMQRLRFAWETGEIALANKVVSQYIDDPVEIENIIFYMFADH